MRRTGLMRSGLSTLSLGALAASIALGGDCGQQATDGPCRTCPPVYVKICQQPAAPGCCGCGLWHHHCRACGVQIPQYFPAASQTFVMGAPAVGTAAFAPQVAAAPAFAAFAPAFTTLTPATFIAQPSAAFVQPSYTLTTAAAQPTVDTAAIANLLAQAAAANQRAARAEAAANQHALRAEAAAASTQSLDDRVTRLEVRLQRLTECIKANLAD